jgi:hypothetical protein
MTSDGVSKWKELDSILSGLCRTFGLVINPHKPSFHFSVLTDVELTSFKAIFPFKFVDLNESFRYLGFFLRPANYRVEDWRWLIIKFERRIGF